MTGLQRQHATSDHQRGHWLELCERGLEDQTDPTFSVHLDSQGCIYSVKNNANYLTNI